MRGKVNVRNRFLQYNISFDVPVILFFAGLFLHELSVILDTSMWSFAPDNAMTPFRFFAKVIRFTAYGLFLMKILYDCKIGKRNIFFVYLSAAIIGLSFLGSRNTTICFYFLIFIAALSISDRTVLFASLLAQSFMLVITVLASLSGIIENVVKDDRKGRVRDFLGFQWATTGPILFFFIILQVIYLKRGKVNFIEFIIANVINFIFYIYTDSRMVFVMILASTAFFLVFGDVLEKRGSVTRLLKIPFLMLPWILAVFTIYMHKIYDGSNAFLVSLNKSLSNRLYLGNRAIKEYGIHLFGTKIKWVGYAVGDEGAGQYNFVDCSYLKLTLEYGLVFIMFLLMLYSIIIYRSYKSRNYFAVWVTVFILIFGMTEPRLLNLVFNPFVILAFAGGFLSDGKESSC
ncbi:hypothetical protein SAMN04487934_10427 [Eubacterium ruminantium]|nr:hypothetical protein SAMN04487934_10427 [Eubacterium ruminantium]